MFTINHYFSRTFYFCLLLVFGGLFPTKSHAQKSNFTFIGPGGGGAQFFPSINPHDNTNLFVACDMGGAYVSYDQGGQWHMFNLINKVNGFVFDPSQDSVVYAVATGLFRSNNRGKSWRLIFPEKQQIGGIVSKGDHAEDVMVSKDHKEIQVIAAAIDPASSKKLYLIARESTQNFLYSSNTGGNQWTKEVLLPVGSKNIFIDPLSPRQNRAILIAGAEGIFQRVNNRWVMSSMPSGIRLLRDFSAGVDSLSKTFLIYAIAEKQNIDAFQSAQSLYVSDNRGKKWIDLSLNFPGDSLSVLRTLATSNNYANNVYVSFSQYKVKGMRSSGVAHSTDGGKSWDYCWLDIGEKAAINFSRDWINERFGPTWGDNPLCLGVSPNNPNLCIATDFGRTIMTVDGGRKWKSVYSTQVGNGWKTNGMEVTTNYDIVYDPFNPAHRFLLYTDIGLFESFDGGNSWNSATGDRGVPESWVNTCYSLIFDPVVKGRAWAAMSGIHDLPRPKMFRRNGTTNFNGGILFTENSGKTWTPVSNSIGEGAVTDLLLDTNSTAAERTLYACVFGKGIYKSTDGGKTWILKIKGFDSQDPFAWRVIQGNDGFLYAIVSRRSEDGSINTDKDGAVYLSRDGAENWQKVKLPEGANGPTSLALVNNTMLLSCWGRVQQDVALPDIGGGIYLSTDEGRSWKTVMVSDQHIHDITYDPRNSRFYACGFEGAAYYSDNDGNDWRPIKGYNFKWGKKVTPDPDDPDKIYIITFGGGVWHGPAKGDINTKDDIIPSLKWLKK